MASMEPESHPHSSLTTSKKLNKLESQQPSLDPSGKWGHRAKHCLQTLEKSTGPYRRLQSTRTESHTQNPSLEFVGRQENLDCNCSSAEGSVWVSEKWKLQGDGGWGTTNFLEFYLMSLTRFSQWLSVARSELESFWNTQSILLLKRLPSQRNYSTRV